MVLNKVEAHICHIALDTRAHAISPIEGAPSVAPLGQRGITGTYLSGGQITGKEQNLRITGQNWIHEAEEMLATDPVVAASWRVLKQTLLEAILAMGPRR